VWDPVHPLPCKNADQPLGDRKRKEKDKRNHGGGEYKGPFIKYLLLLAFEALLNAVGDLGKTETESGDWTWRLRRKSSKEGGGDKPRLSSKRRSKLRSGMPVEEACPFERHSLDIKTQGRKIHMLTTGAVPRHFGSGGRSKNC